MGARTPEENRAFSKMQQMSMTALRKLGKECEIDTNGMSRKVLLLQLVGQPLVVERLGVAPELAE